jgi:hypothetical protein
MIYVINNQAFAKFSRSRFESLLAQNFQYYTVHSLKFKDPDEPEVDFFELIFYPSKIAAQSAIQTYSSPQQIFLQHISDHDAIELTENHDLAKFLIKEQ